MVAENAGGANRRAKSSRRFIKVILAAVEKVRRGTRSVQRFSHKTRYQQASPRRQSPFCLAHRQKAARARGRSLRRCYFSAQRFRGSRTLRLGLRSKMPNALVALRYFKQARVDDLIRKFNHVGL